MDLTCGAISVAVDRLHGRGLVTRTEDPADRRVRLVDLTVEGRRLTETVFNRHAADMEEMLRVLSDEERIQLEYLLKKVGCHAEKSCGRLTEVQSACPGGPATPSEAAGGTRETAC